jgi:hypothetical protein
MHRRRARAASLLRGLVAQVAREQHELVGARRRGFRDGGLAVHDDAAVFACRAEELRARYVCVVVTELLGGEAGSGDGGCGEAQDVGLCRCVCAARRVEVRWVAHTHCVTALLAADRVGCRCRADVVLGYL